MSLSSEEAQASLAEAENARRRSAELYGYHKASPHLIMWGIIWVFGYTGTALLGRYIHWGWIWGLLMLAGVAGDVLVNWKCARREDHRGSYSWRSGAILAIAVFFALATYAIMWPIEGKQYAVFPVLMTGCIYMAMGLWAGLRLFLTGVAVVALAMIGFYYIDHILYWMAFVGGGSMILAGFWFRRV